MCSQRRWTAAPHVLEHEMEGAARQWAEQLQAVRKWTVAPLISSCVGVVWLPATQVGQTVTVGQGDWLPRPPHSHTGRERETELVAVQMNQRPQMPRKSRPPRPVRPCMGMEVAVGHEGGQDGRRQ